MEATHSIWQRFLRVLIAFLLKFLDLRGGKGTLLYNAIARVTVSVAIEAVIFRQDPESGEWEVFLTRRRPDEAYPEQWHCPGSVKRPGESDADVLVRLSRQELGAGIVLSSMFAGHFESPKEARGHFVHLVYFCYATGEIPLDERKRWCLVDVLPDSTVDHHREQVIPIAFGKLTSTKS